MRPAISKTSEIDASRWITEQAKVLSQEADALWVAADKTSACGGCKAKSGCGTSLLAKLGSQQVAVRALLPEHLRGSHFTEGENIELAIERNAFVKVALVMYLLPISVMIGAVVLALGMAQFLIVMAAVFGLLVGGWLASVTLKRWRNDERLQPVVIRRILPEGEYVVELREYP